MAAATHLLRGLGHGQRIAVTPIARAVEPDALGGDGFNHVDGAHGRGLRFGIKRDAGPEALIEDFVDGVFLDMVDDDALRLHDTVGLEAIHDEARALTLILEVRCVHENHLVILHREGDVLLEHLHLIARVLVEADFADAEHRRGFQKFWDEREDVGGERHVFRLLRIDAEPRVMRQAVLGGALGLMLRQLAEVVVEAIGRLAVEARPESWLADRRAAREDHRLVVIRGAAHHVAVWFDIAHGRGLLEAGPDARGRLGVGLFNRDNRGVAPEIQDLGHAAFILFQKERERGAEAANAMVFAARGAVEAVEEGRQIEQLIPRVHEMEVGHLLAGASGGAGMRLGGRHGGGTPARTLMRHQSASEVPAGQATPP